MELIGIQLHNYASFGSAYVPLRKGINLLVGKNNSGKTALLRSVTMLNQRLDPREVYPEINGYYTTIDGSNDRLMDLVFELQPEDASRVAIQQEQWVRFISEEHPVLYCEVLLPNLVFGACDMRGKTKAAPLLSWGQDNVLYRCQINPDLSSGGVVGRVLAQTSGSPSGRQYLSEPYGQFFVGIHLPKVRLVEAHRASIPRQAMASITVLDPRGEQLANHLLNLLPNERPKFDLIETFVTSVFPEFQRLNPQHVQNQVFITFTLKNSEQTIPLTHCGTGVEQVLSLATFVVTSERGSVILLDEPHSYLHPTAERQLISFLREHDEHTFVVATHSTILINSVEPSQIAYVERGRSSTYRELRSFEMSELFELLGYRNSDFVFFDRLILVEGISDHLTLEVILKKLGKTPIFLIDSTGFPLMHGVPGAGKPGSLRKNVTALQTSILRCEEFLQEISRTRIPRVYLFDGDFDKQERQQLEGTKGGTIKVRFLKRHELENYLIDPEAVAHVLTEELRIADPTRSAVSAVEVAALIAEALESMVGNIDRAEALRFVQGSQLLNSVFQHFASEYDKSRHAFLLARQIKNADEAGWQEVWDLVADLF
jgi:energy-coupling factor transporter ATP-binding protein EcfA2